MTIVFLDVDTQKDFVNKDGALYVSGAEEIKPTLEKITDFALSRHILVLGSVDRHYPEDAELQRNGGPFPDHCMTATIGQSKIKETKIPFTLFVDAKRDETVGRDIKNSKWLSIVFEKQSYSVWDNPNFEDILKVLGVTSVFVYGVATDYCVKSAVLGLLKRKIETTVIVDAISAVDPKGGSEALSEMKKAGAEFVTFDTLQKTLGVSK